ncbi:MAG: hypothetical protein ACOCYT_04240 [Chloroflexota bacterium]
MSSIAFLIEQVALGLYIFIGVGLVWAWRRWVNARYAYRATTFELERDYAREQRSGALFVFIILVELGLVVAGVQNVVAPTIREDRAVMQAMARAEPVAEVQSLDGVFATSTPPVVLEPPNIDASGIELGDSAEVAVFVTPTLTPTPVGTIEPNAPAVLGCDSPNATLQIPANGMRVFQVITVRGTAYAEDFASFKLEVAGPETLGQYSVIYEDYTPAEQLTTLYQFNPDPYEPGTYKFRLAVFDTTTTLVEACEVTIYISRPIPTPTPLSG